MRKRIGPWTKKTVAVLCALAMVVPAVPGTEAKADTSVGTFSQDFNTFTDVWNAPEEGKTEDYTQYNYQQFTDAGIITNYSLWNKGTDYFPNSDGWRDSGLRLLDEDGNKYMAVTNRANSASGPMFDISQYGLKPGDKISYSFRARRTSLPTANLENWKYTAGVLTRWEDVEDKWADRDYHEEITPGEAGQISDSWETFTGEYVIPETVVVKINQADTTLYLSNGSVNYFVINENWHGGNEGADGDYGNTTFHLDDIEFTVIKQDTASIKAANLTLDGTINVNFYLDIPERIKDVVTVTAKYTENGTEESVDIDSLSVSEEEATKGCYIYTQKVSAKEMMEPITVTLTNKVTGEPITSATKTVQGCAQYYIENHSTDTNLVALSKAMLDYGAKAQTYFGYGDELADSILEGYVNSITADDVKDYAQEKGGAGSVGEFYASSLLTDSETTIRHYFKLDKGVTAGDYHMVCSYMGSASKDYTEITGTLTPAEEVGDNVYYAEIPNVAAQDLDVAFTVKLVDVNDNQVSDIKTYSAYSYAQLVLSYYANESGEATQDAYANLVGLAKGLVNYGMCASTYFGELQGGAE